MRIKIYIDDHCNVYTDRNIEEAVQKRLEEIKKDSIDNYCTYWMNDLIQEGKGLTLHDLFVIDDEKKATYYNLFSTWLIETAREEAIEDMLVREVEI